MSNYNSTLQSNNTDLQVILNTINELPNAGGEPILQNKTVTPSTNKQTITADSGYDGLDTVTVNAMPTATQATPTITVDSSTGLITATATQTAGYVTAGTKSGTKQLAFQPAQTITPTTTNQTAVPAGYYTGGNITVKGDSNLVAENIKTGTTIFGIAGTYEGASGGGSSPNIETYDLIVESDGNTRLHYMEYVTYNNNEYQYHNDSFYMSTATYPMTLHNVVLGTPIKATVSGGIVPALNVNIDWSNIVFAHDYIADIYDLYLGYFIPLKSNNGTITLSCYDDD